MIKILITGAGSYIGQAFQAYIGQWPDLYKADSIAMRNGAWEEKDFSAYNVVCHVAGIAHQKETAENADLYYKVNRDLTFDVAKKAKNAGVEQFIFLSSVSVYGLDEGIIDEDTPLKPKTHYGKSKLEAEVLLKNLEDDTFKVAIIRPPMVYGKNCKGNFQKLINLVRLVPIFPKSGNRRSMIYIDNLSNYIKLCIDEGQRGVFLPQNREYVCTDDMARHIAEAMGKKVYVSTVLGWAVKAVAPFVTSLRKAFGSLVIKDLEKNGFSYEKIGFDESVKRSL